MAHMDFFFECIGKKGRRGGGEGDSTSRREKNNSSIRILEILEVITKNKDLAFLGANCVIIQKN